MMTGACPRTPRAVTRRTAWAPISLGCGYVLVDAGGQLRLGAAAREGGRRMSGPHIEETPGSKPRWSPRDNNKLLIAAVLTTSIVVGGALVGYGVSQLPGYDSRQSAEQIAKQREADQLEAQRQAEQIRAAAQASQATTIAEGQVVSVHIANANAMRTEFGNVMNSLSAKAKSSASASRAWDRAWAKRKADYASRTAAVRSHNYSERQRYYGSRTERANSAGKLVIVYTYRPRYWSNPAAPGKPAPLKVSVDPEVERLSVLKGQVDTLMTTVASLPPAAQSFGSVYQSLAAAVQALGKSVDDARGVARTLVVKKADKGRVIAASKLSKIDQGTLEAPFSDVDQSFAAALTAVGLTPAQVTTGGAGTP